MNKKLIFLLLATLVLVGSLIGCGGEAPAGGNGAEAPAPAPAPAETVHISIGTAPAGGDFYNTGVLIADILNQELTNYRVNAEPTDAAVDNIRRMQRGEMEMGFTYAANVYWAVRGEEIFDEEIPLDILIATTTAPWHLMVRADSGIDSWADLAGKRVAGVPAGGLVGWKIIDRSLEFYGMTRDDLAAMPAVTNLPDMIEEIKAGDFDGIVWPFPVRGAPAFIDLGATTDLKWISMEEDHMDYILEELPFLSKVTIPAGSNEGQPMDFTCVAEITLIMIRPDLDEQVVYEMTEALAKNLHRFEELSVAGREVTLERAVAVKDVLNYHPGAVKYYQEQGVW